MAKGVYIFGHEPPNIWTETDKLGVSSGSEDDAVGVNCHASDNLPQAEKKDITEVQPNDYTSNTHGGTTIDC